MLTRFGIPILALPAVIGFVFTAAQAQALPDAEELVRRAQAGRDRYIEVFQNLLAEEMKTFEVYRENGEVRRRRKVGSTFIIYRLARGEDQLAEFRNVTHVDGKPVEKAAARAERFFSRLAESESSAAELARISDESFRYDPDVRISGLTLIQAVPLAENIVDALRFQADGKDVLDGRAVYILSYEQLRPSEYIRVNRGEHADRSKTALSYEIEGPTGIPLNERIRGRFWLDAETFQIRREVRDITVHPGNFPEPVVVSHTDSFYHDSEFGILTPKRILHVLYELKMKERRAVKDLSALFEYSRFTKPDVEIRSAEVK